MAMTLDDTGIRGDREFPTTAWGLLSEAAAAEGAERARCLGRLIALYWKPVYCVVRRAYAGASGDPRQEAQDLTQDFFATVLLDRDLVGAYDPRRGSFRTFLRTALSRYMNDVARGRARDKRGGGRAPLPLDAASIDWEPALAAAGPLTPEQLFDAAWNEALLGEAFARLEQRLRLEGKGAAFEVFRRYDVDGESATLSYEALGSALGLSAAQVRHALEAARSRFREIVTELVRGYVDSPAELAAELRRLLGA